MTKFEEELIELIGKYSDAGRVSADDMISAMELQIMALQEQEANNAED